MCPGDALIAVGADVRPNMVSFLNKQGTEKCRKMKGWITKQVKDESLVSQALALATNDCVYVENKGRPVRSRGLGDTVAKVTKAVGIKPCKGCGRRQELLNKLVPYKE